LDVSVLGSGAAAFASAALRLLSRA